MLKLAAQVPAPVLADLLGMHVNTATTSIKIAQGDWAAYAASGGRNYREIPGDC